MYSSISQFEIWVSTAMHCS